MKRQFRIAALGLVLSFGACDIAGWSPAVLAPLVRLSVPIESVATFGQTITAEIAASDVGLTPGGPIVIAPFTRDSVGPIQVKISDLIESVAIKDGQMDGNFRNDFPVPISAGTRIVLKSTANAADTTNVIADHTIASTIQPGESYQFVESLNGITLPSITYLYLRNFHSDGGTNVTVGDDTISVAIGIQINKIVSANVLTGLTEQATDTMEIEVEVQPEQQESVSGELVIYVDNAVPINADLQIYFLQTRNGPVLDSLFASRLEASGAPVSGGNVTGVTSTKTQVVISADRLEKLSWAKVMVLHYGFNTQGYSDPIVTVLPEQALDVQLVGDVVIKVGA